MSQNRSSFQAGDVLQNGTCLFSDQATMTLQKILDDLLKKYGVEQKELCAKAKVNPSSLSRYINQTGKKDIQFNTLLRLVRELPPQARVEFWWQVSMLSLTDAPTDAETQDSEIKTTDEPVTHKV